MDYAYRKRPAARSSTVSRAAPSASRGYTSFPNSSMPGALDGGMGREALMQAMQNRLGFPLHSAYANPRAESEADRIGKRFSDASGVEDLKERMGSALGADFSAVRFHTGASSRAAAPDDSFTSGRDIHLGGAFNPMIAAHEMVHTVQTGAVHAAAPVMSVPSGAVQCWNPIKSLVKAHRKALDDYHNNEKDYKDMSGLSRFKWVLKNPLAAMRRNHKSALRDTKRRNASREYVDNFARMLSSKWKPEDLGDASGMTLPGEAPAQAENVPAPAENVPAPAENVPVQEGDDPDMPKDMNEGMSLPIPIISTGDAFKADVKNAKMLKSEGNMGGARKARAYAAADALALGTSAYSYGGMLTPLPGADLVGDLGSAGSNLIKAGTDFVSSIGNGISQRRLRKRSEKLEAQLADSGIAEKDRGSLNKEQNYELTRQRAAHQGKRAAAVRKSEDINSGVSNLIKVPFNVAAAGIKAAGLAVPIPYVGKYLGTAVGIGGSILGAISKGIGGIFTGRKKKEMKHNTVNEELGIKDKIKALRSGDEEYISRLGITKEIAGQLSKSQAKHIILKSMGFKSGKYKEAFNQITKNRARALTERANAGGEEEIGMMKDMFLKKVDLGDGKKGYSTAGVARKLGYERFYSNPFQKDAEANRAKKAKKKEE